MTVTKASGISCRETADYGDPRGYYNAPKRGKQATRADFCRPFALRGRRLREKNAPPSLFASAGLLERQPNLTFDCPRYTIRADSVFTKRDLVCLTSVAHVRRVLIMRFRNCRQLSVFHNLPETLLFLLCFCAAGLGFLISLGDRAFALDSDENSAVIRISRNGASTDDSSLEMTGQIERYEVDPENKVLCSVDGVLYSKDRKTLVLFPKKYPAKEFEIPSGVTKIEERAFAGSCELESVVVPGSRAP